MDVVTAAVGLTDMFTLAGGAALASIADSMHHAVAALPQGLMAPAPDPDPQAPPGMQEVASQFLGWGKWILLVAGVLGMFISSGMMIIGRRNRSSTAVDGAAGIPWVLGGLFLAAVAASIVSAIAL